jgi:Cupin-like domain
VTSGWEVRSTWSADTNRKAGDASKLHPALSTLQDHFGDQKVPVVSQLKSQGIDGEHLRETTLADAIELMKASSKLDSTDETQKVHYVKDWHLFLQLAQQSRSQNTSLKSLYELPKQFRDDWMNHPTLISHGLDEKGKQKDDFRFCYAGQAGTQTHLHADVYTSYSWSTNVVGRKRWRLFPPDVALFLRRFPPRDDNDQEEVQSARTSQLARTVDEMDATLRLRESEPGSSYRDWSRWKEARSRMLEIVQEEGETIFVPSNWYHEVLNLTDCISINHNWCNSINLPSMYQAMKDEVQDVEKSLEDVKEMIRDGPRKPSDPPWQVEWTETVQNVARQDMGWAWDGFWNMIQVNLAEPVCGNDLRPDQATFVRPRLQAILDDFRSRDEWQWLPQEVRNAVHGCQKLLALL